VVSHFVISAGATASIANITVGIGIVHLHLSMSRQTIIFRDLGQMDYQTAWDYQESLLQQNVRLKGQEETRFQTNHYLLFTEHPPVYTLGKSGKPEHVLINEQEQKEKGIAYFKTNRGGDITFHGPQQIVGYPILDLEKFRTDLGWYLRSLEEVIILTLAEYGIKGDRSPGETGVWIDPGSKGKERKICAMGVRCSRWVTMHGFAFNVNTDLSYFDYIIPCGIQNKQVTSLQKELASTLDFEEVKEKVKQNFAIVFEASLIEENQKSFAR
jgi:lipoyl(octanoyl) transferase